MSDTDNKPSGDSAPATASPTPDPAPTGQPQAELIEAQPETATEETPTAGPASPTPDPAEDSSSENHGEDAPSNPT